MIGDGYTLVEHCENLEDFPMDREPDSNPVYCCNFKVICDDTNNTKADIDANIVHITLIPIKKVEFLEIDFVVGGENGLE